MRRFLSILFSLLFCVSTLPASPKSGGFQIVFSVYPEYFSQQYLDSIKAWGATGVSVFVNWWQYQGDSGRANIHFDRLKPIVDRIIANSLDVYFRVGLGQRPSWTIDTVHRASRNGNYLLLADGSPRRCGLGMGGWQLNFSSPWSLKHMLVFYQEFLSFARGFPSYRIKEMMPSVSPASELEYDSGDWVDFSDAARADFQKFLRTRYKNVDSLNKAWKSKFRSYSDVDPSGYRWNDTDNSNDRYGPGRIDWLNFRTAELKKFVDTLAALTHKRGLKMALQVGSLYDEAIERRGWTDPTSLVEHVDLLINDDVFMYRPQFSFVADLMRSICSFWNATRTDRRKTQFGTESNWPGYTEGYSDRTAAQLCDDWKAQLETCYKKGASMLSISGWEMPSDPANPGSNSFMLPSTASQYAAWRAVLLKYRNAPLQRYTSFRAVHISLERQAYEHNRYTESKRHYRTFDIFSSGSAHPSDAASQGYDGASDIITDMMIERNPKYLNRYSSGLWYTESSNYISKPAYKALKRKDVKVKRPKFDLAPRPGSHR